MENTSDKERLRRLEAKVEKLMITAGHHPELFQALRGLQEDIARDARRRAAQEILTPQA